MTWTSTATHRAMSGWLSRLSAPTLRSPTGCTSRPSTRPPVSSTTGGWRRSRRSPYTPIGWPIPAATWRAACSPRATRSPRPACPGRRSRSPTWRREPGGLAAAGLIRLLARGRLGDLHQELDVRPGLLEPVEQEVQRLLGIQRVQHLAQLEHDRQLVGREQDLFLTGTGRVDVDRREHPLVGDLPVQLQLGVAGALELLEDHRVTGRAGLHQRGGEDRQRTAVLDVAGGAQEPLRRGERGGG